MATAAGTRIRATWIAIAVVAVLTASVGAAMAVRRQAAADNALRGTATLGGLTARPHDAGWLNMDNHMDTQGGYQMPAQMMPGAPTGDEMRLGIPMTLLNSGADMRPFSLVDEFWLGGGRNGAPRRLHSDTFGILPRLTPGNAVDGILYFDTVVPAAGDPPLYLLWTRDGTEARMAVPLPGDAPEHGHDS